MILFHGQFFPNAARQLKAVYETVALIASSMQRFGQIEGDYFVSRHKGRVHLYAHFVDNRARHRKFCSHECQGFIDRLESCLLRAPTWDRIENRSAYPVGSLADATSLLLFAQPLISVGPIRHGRNGSRVPAYTLPISESVREELYDWACSYRATATVYLGSGAISRRALAELGIAGSDLMDHGRRLCSTIEGRTSRPTFLMVENFDGKSAAALADGKCPSCGRPLDSDIRPLPIQFVKAVCIECRLAFGV